MKIKLLKYGFLLCCFFFTGVAASAQTDSFSIGSHQFLIIKKANKTEYGKSDTTASVYRLNGNGKTLLFDYTAYSYGADCNNEFTDRGRLSVSGNDVIINTRHFQKRADPIPQRSRQVYRLNPKGNLTLISDKEQYAGKGWVNTENK